MALLGKHQLIDACQPYKLLIYVDVAIAFSSISV
jgi:hypothetical protein